MRRTIFFLLLGVLVFNLSACSAPASQTIAAPGKLVDVGGYNIHLNCVGEHTDGQPTVVLFAGAMGYSLDWGHMPQQIADRYHARVCTYDRAGLGWSNLPPTQRTLANMDAELYTALTNAGEKAPYMLVAHSWGSSFAAFFAAQYPDAVWPKGLMLDPISDEARPNAFAQVNPKAAEIFKKSNEQLDLLVPLCKSGALGLMNPKPASYALIPADLQPAVAQNFLNCDNLVEVVAENDVTDATYVELTTIFGKPLPVTFTILQSDYAFGQDFKGFLGDDFPYDEYAKVAHEGQVKLCQNYGAACAELRLIEGSGHYIQLTTPDAVLDEIGNLFQ